jgi:hypothetical protein
MKNLSQNQKVKILKIPALPVFKEKKFLFVVYLNLIQGESRHFGR